MSQPAVAGHFASGTSPAVAPRPSDLNVLILNTHLPIFPGGGGVEYLTTTRLAALADHVGLVSMAHTRGDLERTQGLVDAGVDLYLWESPYMDAVPAAGPVAPSLRRRVHAWIRDLVDAAKAWPHRPSDTIILDGCFRNMAAGLRTALAERSWQVLSVVESSAAAMIDYLPRPPVAVLVMHDIRSVVYERRAKTAESPWQRWRLRRQARRYDAFEREYCRRYDLVTTVSREDAEWVREHYRPRRVITVPLPVDAQYFAPQPATAAVPGRVVFTGLMNHPPNADAARFFARDVLPTVRRAVPEAEFYVVGRHPPPDVQALSGQHGVHVTGGVPDIRPYLADATVVVVPLRYGSGARQKILEAWCMEKCVVSTTVGAEGLAYQDGANLAIADDAATMAERVIQGLRDEGFRNGLRHAGRNVALVEHHPARIAADYHRELRAVVADKARQDTPMRVALDMRWMLPGLAGGLENLARSFMRHLIALDRHNSYTAILPARCRYDFDVREDGNVRIATRDSFADDVRRVRQRLRHALHARLRLDDWESADVLDLRFARSLNAEIAYSFPGYIRPDLYPLRQVLMVPDIQHEYCPEFFSPEALEERRRLYGDAIDRADHICAISEFTRQTLIARLGVSPDKVTAIPLAADPIFSAAVEPERDASTLRRYGLSAGGYFYFPGHTWHHKNHRTAIEALRILRDRHGLRPLLVCSGGGREAQPDIDQQVNEAGLSGQVRFLGYCPHGHIPALYRGAAGLVFPSLFEGFGIPVLEAMASGCPVVCSSTTSLPEIAGEAALLVDPADPDAWADAMGRVWRGADLRAELRERGLARAKGFSWARHTWETIGVFHQVHRKMRDV
jgi:glycosyltransferase involved in cell wall biosynthesis